MSGTWYDSAVTAIREATADLPADMPLADRMKVVDAAYPFGQRRYFPYKAWLRARQAYLRVFGYEPRGSKQVRLPLSPLEVAMRKGAA